MAKIAPYYPIFVDLEGKKVVVVGGGVVAQRKIERLLEFEAQVHVISQELNATLAGYLREGRIKFIGREFTDSERDGAFMVIAATDDSPLNHRVSKSAMEKGLLVNVVDEPYDCNFIVPSVLRRGDLLIAVSTSGKSPALAKRLRKELEKRFGREYESLLTLMGRLRKKILSRGLSQGENRRIFTCLAEDPLILEVISRKDWKELAGILNEVLGTKLSSKDVIKLVSKRTAPSFDDN
jgi:precorrin-2 dehydrogenase/sirohydrochlorin ferrochelatase